MALEPVTSPKKVGSKDIVREFLDSNLLRAKVDVSEYSRSKESIYISLRAYLLNHPRLGVSVTQQDGQIILQRD